MATNTKDFVSRYGVSAPVIKSTVSTGTAPLQVASTTLVPNLNVQYLNGIQSSGFLTNPMSALGDVIYGGAAGAATRLAGQTTNGVYFLAENVTASAAVAPTWLGSTGSNNVVLSTSPTITTPVIDSIVAAGGASTTTIHSAVTTGSITIGAGLTTGALNLAAAGSGATAIAIGHTNAVLTIIGSATFTGAHNITSPAVTTSLTTPSTSFDLVDTTATTVNFARAATTLVMGATSGSTTVRNDLTVTGNLTVNGTTQTINSTVVTIDDPVFTLGGDTAPGSDDNKDRGIEFRWHNGTVAKVGFFGFDDSTGYFTFIPDATNTTEVFSGAQGDIQATNFRGALIGNADTATTATTATKATNLVGGNNTTLLGAMPYQSNTDTTTLLGPNTTSTKKFLRMTGTGSNGAAPAWDTLVDGDVPSALTGKTYNGLTLTANATGFQIAGGTTSKTMIFTNSITLSGTDATTITLPSTTGTVALNNQTFFLGTTSVAINRTSANLALTGITSIDGTAAGLAMTNADASSKNVNVTANATPTTIDSWAVATYRSAMYLVQMVQGTKVTTSSLLIMWDGTDVQVTEYGVVDATAGAANATLTATHSAGTMTVSASSSDAATTNVVIKAAVTYVKA